MKSKVLQGKHAKKERAMDSRKTSQKRNGDLLKKKKAKKERAMESRRKPKKKGRWSREEQAKKERAIKEIIE